MKHLFATLVFSTLAAFAAATDDLVINRVFINPQGANDDSQGLELFEIKNVGTTTVNLATAKVALVGIENETGQSGELDFWYKFTGSLDPGAVLTIQDKNTGGTSPSFTAPNATTYGTGSSLTSTELFPFPNNAVDISNSGHNYILVSGFDNTKIDPNTSHAYAFAALLDDSGVNLKFDFKETVATTDDLWTGEYDAMVVAPDAVALDDYTTYLSLPHKVVGIDQGAWTPDYIWRLHYNNGSAEVYDKAMAADVNALSSGQITLDSSELNTLDGSGWVYTGTGMQPPIITGYATREQYGNWTSWTGFTGITISSHLYVH
ncbi:hypothetical protein BH11ARM2_BH11ARM2_01080 [soil metagenome]